MSNIIVSDIEGVSLFPALAMNLSVRGNKRNEWGTFSGTTYCSICNAPIFAGHQYVYDPEEQYRYCLGCVLWREPTPQEAAIIKAKRSEHRDACVPMPMVPNDD